MTTDTSVGADAPKPDTAAVTGAADPSKPAAGATGADPAKAASGADPAATSGATGAASGADPAKPGVWNDGWREAYAGEDQAKLNVLKRYADPKTALDALFALQEKVRSGEVRKPLGKDATAEQITEYRKANGIPDVPEKYLEALPAGVVFGDDDKAAVGTFLKDMHGKNASPEIVAAALASYKTATDAQTQAIQDRDIAKRGEAEEVLRQEWGPDYKGNITSVKMFLENNFEKDIQEALINGRLGDADGTPLLCHPGVIRAFAQLGRDLNPTGTISSGKGMDSIDTINEMIKGYEGRMATKEWYKDEKAQTHYRQLVTAKERLSGANK